MSQATGVPSAIAQAPLRTVRVRDVAAYAHPHSQLTRLEQRGVMHRLSAGFYVVVPHGSINSPWLPTLEGAAAGIAAAEFGERNYALMAVSAARLHRVLPRSLATAFIAAPRRRQEVRLSDRDATIRFWPRDLNLVQVEVMRTDLGECLVTTPEQTVLDLAHMRTNHLLADVISEAIPPLLARCNDATLNTIAKTQRLARALAYVRSLARL